MAAKDTERNHQARGYAVREELMELSQVRGLRPRQAARCRGVDPLERKHFPHPEVEARLIDRHSGRIAASLGTQSIGAPVGQFVHGDDQYRAEG